MYRGDICQLYLHVLNTGEWVWTLFKVSTFLFEAFFFVTIIVSGCEHLQSIKLVCYLHRNKIFYLLILFISSVFHSLFLKTHASTERIKHAPQRKHPSNKRNMAVTRCTSCQWLTSCELLQSEVRL